VNWTELKSEEQLTALLNNSSQPEIQGILIFKHSTRCSISKMALSRLERDWNLHDEKISAYFLDLIKFRDVSNKIAELLKVTHESPQVLLIKNGTCFYNASHNKIRFSELPIK